MTVSLVQATPDCVVNNLADDANQLVGFDEQGIESRVEQIAPSTDLQPKARLLRLL